MAHGMFTTYSYRLADVLPDEQAMADYLHLDDKAHPAYAFMQHKLQELSATPLKAVGGYVLLPVEHIDVRQGCLDVAGTSLLVNRQICGYMRGATKAALFLCTAGEVFTKQYRDYSDSRDYLEAYVTDSIGSLTVENAMDRVQQQLQDEVVKEGLRISNRYSPGYCNWPLDGQHDLFRLIGDNPTGIQLSASSLMYPTKSVSGIIGIGAQMRRREYGCAICKNANCIYRRIVQHDK